MVNLNEFSEFNLYIEYRFILNKTFNLIQKFDFFLLTFFTFFNSQLYVSKTDMELYRSGTVTTTTSQETLIIGYFQTTAIKIS